MPKLTPGAVLAIETAVEKMFSRSKSRFLGRVPPNTPKGVILTLNPTHSIASIFKLAAKTEGVKHNEDLLSSVSKIGLSYLDAIKEKAKAKAVHKVQSFLTDAHNQNIDTDMETVLSGELTNLWGELSSDVKRIVETETHSASNMSSMDAITKINLSAGIKDPVVAFLCVHDQSLCEECKRLHLLADKVTPRVWRLSEVGAGYHKKGQPNPKISGLHPNERCIMVTIMPGYGFSSGGQIEYKEPGWDELASQRSK